MVEFYGVGIQFQVFLLCLLLGSPVRSLVKDVISVTCLVVEPSEARVKASGMYVAKESEISTG